MGTYGAAALAALGDPTRQSIVELLAAGPRSVGELAGALPVSRPAVSQHLKVLKQAGLVTDRAVGTRRLYQLDPAGALAVRAYLDRFWTTALDAFKAAVEREEDVMGETAQDVVVRRSVTVAAPVERAFAVFADGFDGWWPLEHHLGDETPQVRVLEQRAGGRWFERDPAGVECDWGRVLAWDPPRRLLLAWQIDGEWTYDPDRGRASEIEVRFTPDGGGTRVDLEHRHIQRHGEGWPALLAGLESAAGWPGIMDRYAATAGGAG